MLASSGEMAEGASPTAQWKRVLRAVVVMVLLVLPFALYRLVDPERLELDEAARTSAPGRFAKLTDGFTHYELAGPEGGRAIVLAAGFSVPYYIWDPTFD